MTSATKSPYAGYRFPGEVISMLSWPRPSVGTIWTFLDRVGLTFKKVRSRREYVNPALALN